MNSITTETHPLRHHITKCHEGFIYWKGIHIEHFSFRDPTEEQEAINHLCIRCAHLEKIGVPVNISTVVWHWSWFASSQQRDPWNNILLSIHSLYVHKKTGEVAIPSNHRHELGSNAPIAYASYLGGTGALQHIAGHPNGEYHAFLAAGFAYANVGQDQHLGLCYATREQMITFLRGHGITPDLPPFGDTRRLAA